MAFEILVMIYYTFDSSYPKHHQLFLQIARFIDEAPFHKKGGGGNIYQINYIAVFQMNQLTLIL